MATFTTMVKDICGQAWLNQNPGQTLPRYDVIIPAVSKTVLPISVSADSPFTADSVAQAILRHYWMREIGLETVAFWQYYMVTRLQEILPKYVEIAKAQGQMGNIFDNFGYQENGQRDITRNTDFTGEATESGTSKETGNTTSEVASERKDAREDSRGNNVILQRSDTPQNGLADVQAGRYLTSAEVNTDNETSSGSVDSSGASTSSGTNVVDKTVNNTQNREDNTKETVGETDSRTRTGFTGDKVKTMWDYSQYYVNIYQMIIGDVADLFMSVLG